MKRKIKNCVGCQYKFLTLKNYDYCKNCAVNNNRYLTKGNCAECDGSEVIKFRNRPLRICKLCYLTKKNMNIIKKKNMKDGDENLTYWDEVDQKTHYLIADKLNQILPLTNLRKKENFNPNDDADYRTLLAHYEDYYGDDLPDQDQLSEEIAYEYLLLVVESLLGHLRNFSCHQEENFEKLF